MNRLERDRPVVYVNGKFVPESRAKVSVFDQGLIFGDGVYDTLVVVNGYVFKLDQHVERLLRSAKAVKMDLGRSGREIGRLVVETVRRNGLRDAYVKVIATRGVGPKPLLGRGDVTTPTLIVFAVPPVSVVPEESIEKGARLLSTTIRRTHPESLDPRVKSLNYLPNVLMRREAIERGADECVCYGFDGYVAEGGAENIWVRRGDVLLTPGHGILEGITRETVFEIAAELGYSTATANLTKYDLYQAEEVFLCSTAGGMIPVTEVDGRTVGTGRPGRMTTEIKKKYAAMLRDGVHGTPVFRSAARGRSSSRPKASGYRR